MFKLIQRQLRGGINTELIKKRVNEQLAMGKGSQVPEYPKTF